MSPVAPWPGDIRDRDCRYGKPRKATTVTVNVAVVRHARRQAQSSSRSSSDGKAVFLVTSGDIRDDACRFAQ
jgi:hypothetical protein